MRELLLSFLLRGVDFQKKGGIGSLNIEIFYCYLADI